MLNINFNVPNVSNLA